VNHYTVAVGRSWHQSTGNPAPDYTCGHKHRTYDAANRCLDRIYASRYDARGNWTASARWHDAYILNAKGEKV
jgi:hypothetical protein